MKNLRSSKTSVSFDQTKKSMSANAQTSSNAPETPVSGSSSDLQTVGAPSNPGNRTFSSLNHTLNSNPRQYSLEVRTTPCLTTCMDTEAIRDHNWIHDSRPYSCPGVVSLDSAMGESSSSSIDCKTMERQASIPCEHTSGQGLRAPVRLGGYVTGKVVDSISEFTLRRSTRDKPSKGRQLSNQSLTADREHSWQSISATNIEGTEKSTRKRSTLTSLKPASSSPPRKRSTTKNKQSKVLVERKNEVIEFCRRNFHPEEPTSGDNTVLLGQLMNLQTKTNDHDYFSSNNTAEIFELISYAEEKLLLLFARIREDKRRLEFLRAAKYSHTMNDGKLIAPRIQASSEECLMSESRQDEGIIYECARTLINCTQEHAPTSAYRSDEHRNVKTDANILMNFDEQPINPSKSLPHTEIAPANEVSSGDEGLRIECPADFWSLKKLTEVDEEDRDNPDVEILEENGSRISGQNSVGDTFNLDEDYHFLLSLYQQMTRLPRHRRIRMRIRIQGMLYDELYSKTVFKEC